MSNPYGWRSCGGSYGANIAARKRHHDSQSGGGGEPPPSGGGGSDGDPQWNAVWFVSIGAGVVTWMITHRPAPTFVVFVIAFVAMIMLFRKVNKSTNE